MLTNLKGKKEGALSEEMRKSDIKAESQLGTVDYTQRF